MALKRPQGVRPQAAECEGLAPCGSHLRRVRQGLGVASVCGRTTGGDSGLYGLTHGEHPEHRTPRVWLPAGWLGLQGRGVCRDAVGQGARPGTSASHNAGLRRRPARAARGVAPGRNGVGFAESLHAVSGQVRRAPTSGLRQGTGCRTEGLQGSQQRHGHGRPASSPDAPDLCAQPRPVRCAAQGQGGQARGSVRVRPTARRHASKQAGIGPMACGQKPPPDRTGHCEPFLANALRRGVGENQRGFRPSGGNAQPS